jgi:hypothetical protein
METPETRLYYSGFTQQSNSGLQTVFNRCKPRTETRESFRLAGRFAAAVYAAAMLQMTEGWRDHCPQDRLGVAQASEKGLVIRSALDLMCALKLGVRISLDEIRADEMAAILIIAEERDLLEREKSPLGRGRDLT